MEFRDLKKQYEVLKPKIDDAVLQVMVSSRYISGPQVKELEQELDVAEANIIVEENKNNLRLTRNDVRKYIFKCLKKDPRFMLRAFVKEIVVYNDKIDIYYNYHC